MSAATFSEFVKDLLDPFGQVTIKRMFGGHGVFYDGRMFGLIADEVLYLKAAEADEAALRDEGLEPFSYDGKGKPIIMKYWTLPEEALDDEGVLLRHVTRAKAASLQAASKSKKSRKA